MRGYFTTSFLVLALLLQVFIVPEAVVAQSCSSDDYVQSGKLEGLLGLTNDDGSIVYDTAYLSDETWNDENPTNPTTINFEVVYDDTFGFTGRAWSEVFGWIDFDSGSSDQALFETVANNQTEEGWAGWDGEITGLNGVTYSTNQGSFTGQAISATSSGVYVGLIIDFDSAETTANYADDNGCTEYVDLFLNNTNNLYKSECPIATPTIKWTTQNIQSGSCVASGDLWASTGSKSDKNTTGETSAGPVTESGTYPSAQKIKLTCTGLSGSPVVGFAVARCGGSGVGCDPTDPGCIPGLNDVSPDFKEV